MSATVAKWGNSLAIRIPQAIAQQIQLAEGREVEFSVVEGQLVIQLRPQCYSLEQLVSGITPENLHGETESGSAQGNQVW
jgi:antitoxin MazE